MDYDPHRSICFLLNQNLIRDRILTLFTVKIKPELLDDSDSDEAAARDYKMRFEYITEVRLEVSNVSFSSI